MTATAPAKVYFTNLRTHARESQLDKLKRLIRHAGIEQIDFENKFVAIKMHFGELGNLAYLRPNYAKVVADLCKEQGGMPFLTDCNTLYPGSRKNALEHLTCAQLNGFWPMTTGCQVLIADGLRGTDEVEVPVPNGEYCKTARIGRAVMDADIVISLAHFKGHEEAGFGGALKNVSIGIASSNGKRWIHSAGVTKDKWVETPQDAFLESMAEADEAVISHMHGQMMYLNVMNRLSVDCDCLASPTEPDMHDIGVLSSLDLVALDQACVDLIHTAPDGASVTERIASLHGEHILEYAEELGIGSRAYRLTVLD